MPDIAELKGLLERVRAAEVADSMLDREICWVLGLAPWVNTQREYLQFCMPRSRNDLATPKLTSSVDAVVNLIQHELPGWAWKVGTCCVSDDAWVTPDFNHPTYGSRLRNEFPDLKAGSIWDMGIDIDRRPAGNPPLALLEALLTALIAKAERARALSELAELDGETL